MHVRFQRRDRQRHIPSYSLEHRLDVLDPLGVDVHPGASANVHDERGARRAREVE
jgi:hypothetical protein